MCELCLIKLWFAYLECTLKNIEIPNRVCILFSFIMFAFLKKKNYVIVNILQTVATASIFLACKAEDTPRYLNDVVVVAYEMVHKFDSSALHRIRQKVCGHSFDVNVLW